MSSSDENTPKAHYICQTYVEAKRTRDGQVSLKIDKQLQYSTAAAAEERATREFRSENCVGADAYMVLEDTSSDEVSPPEFLVRLGNVPDSE